MAASDCTYSSALNYNYLDSGYICTACYSGLDKTIKTVRSPVIGIAKDGHVIYGPVKEFIEDEKDD